MEDRKLLNNEELEKVAGGTGGSNPYFAAIETAIAEIKMEIGMPDEFDRSVTKTHHKKTNDIYSEMLSKFSALQAMFAPTTEDIAQVFPSSYTNELSGRPKEIYEKFKSAVG